MAQRNGRTKCGGKYMSNASHVMRIEFETGCANSDGEIVKGTERDICILYNENYWRCKSNAPPVPPQS